jgi:Tol biopolymer transport system component
MFTPDGRQAAYVSDSSGQNEVFVKLLIVRKPSPHDR